MSDTRACGQKPGPVVVLWTAPSGYLLACLEALRAASGRRVVLVCFAHSAEAPFTADAVAKVEMVDAADESQWRPLIKIAAGVLICGWHVPSYRRAAREASKSKQTVLFFDNQWRGGPRQQFARLLAPVFLLPSYTACFVPGQRQARYAKRLGFGERPLQLGGYSADVPLFATASPLTAQNLVERRRFIYVGRSNPVKGLDTLAAAYAEYRESAADPWELFLVGEGHHSSIFSKAPGVVCAPFVQPRDLPSVLGRAACFVMPSLFEPWGVALHEAAAAGLMLVASTEVGSGDRFVRDTENGHLFPPGDAGALSAALIRIAGAPAVELERGAALSRQLSQQITPTTWTHSLLTLLRLDEASLSR